MPHAHLIGLEASPPCPSSRLAPTNLKLSEEGSRQKILIPHAKFALRTLGERESDGDDGERHEGQL
eukprot:3776887-Rhodomonas_salina.1